MICVKGLGDFASNINWPWMLRFFELMCIMGWVVSRPGLQSWTSRALSWIQCKLGKQINVQLFVDLNICLGILSWVENVYSKNRDFGSERIWDIIWSREVLMLHGPKSTSWSWNIHLVLLRNIGKWFWETLLQRLCAHKEHQIGRKIQILAEESSPQGGNLLRYFHHPSCHAQSFLIVLASSRHLCQWLPHIWNGSTASPGRNISIIHLNIE